MGDESLFSTGRSPPSFSGLKRPDRGLASPVVVMGWITIYGRTLENELNTTLATCCDERPRFHDRYNGTFVLEDSAAARDNVKARKRQPWLDAFVGARGGGKDGDSKMGIPMTKKKFVEPELSLLRLQQNVEMPETHLIIRPAIQRAADQAIQAVAKISRDVSSGTASQEINFWLSLERAPEGIEAQLRSDENFMTDAGLKSSMDLVRKYNQLTKDFPLNELLSATDLEKNPRIIGTHRSSLDTSTASSSKLSPYPIRRALPLIEAISRNFNDQLLRVLTSHRLSYAPYETFDHPVGQTMNVFRTWDDLIEEFTNVARDVMRKRGERFVPIEVVAAHAQLQERTRYLCDWRKQHKQLAVMTGPTKGLGSMAKEVSGMDAEEEVKKAYEGEGAEIWVAAENTYNEWVARVENQIMAQQEIRMNAGYATHTGYSNVREVSSVQETRSAYSSCENSSLVIETTLYYKTVVLIDDFISIGVTFLMAEEQSWTLVNTMDGNHHLIALDNFTGLALSAYQVLWAQFNKFLMSAGLTVVGLSIVAGLSSGLHIVPNDDLYSYLTAYSTMSSLPSAHLRSDPEVSIRTNMSYSHQPARSHEACLFDELGHEALRLSVYGVVFFNRELRTDETAYEWWSYLDKDRSGDAQPLASNQRLAVRIFSLVPNSMADEQTGSTFTWLNSPLHSWQQAPPPKKKPTVKWRDMTSTIFSGKRKRGKGDNDDDNSENSDVDDDFADEAPNEPDMDNNDSELDVTDPDDIAEDGSKKVDSFDSESFDAASVINLDSRRLVDVLADKGLAPAAPRNTITLPPASTVVQDKVLTEADWDMT
ncbi:dynein heavy chain, N-terminal region 1-domain-containing protein [Suillus variegatus]|nr:dynein heavy chain, N-terminal region 1-domain-containing protein [Suillus variegatus]